MTTILVAEDEPLLGGLIVEILEERGFRVDLVSNGREAMELLRGRRVFPDLVLTDLMMPIMDGLELLKKLRIHYPELPVVVMSGSGGKDHLPLALRLGARLALRKPFNGPELLTVVEDALQCGAVDSPLSGRSET